MRLRDERHIAQTLALGRLSAADCGVQLHMHSSHTHSFACADCRIARPRGNLARTRGHTAADLVSTLQDLNVVSCRPPPVDLVRVKLAPALVHELADLEVAVVRRGVHLAPTLVRKLEDRKHARTLVHLAVRVRMHLTARLSLWITWLHMDWFSHGQPFSGAYLTNATLPHSAWL